MNRFVLHLQGPMMSFADTGFGPIREAGPFPSRSAVLGFLAGAAGIERGDPQLVALHDRLRVHVAAIAIGTLLVDYHTIHMKGYAPFDPSRLARTGAEGHATLTSRSYENDSHYVCVVESEDDTYLSRYFDATHDPKFVGYLGRRCSPPATPLVAREAFGSTTGEALINAVRNGREHRPSLSGKVLAEVQAWLDGEFASDNPAMIAEGTDATVTMYGSRRDRLTAPPRTYVNRPVTHVNYTFSNNSNSHSNDRLNSDFFDAAP